MKPPLTIIAATDFSEPAGRAVERSFRLSGLVGGELHILHGLELVLGGSQGVDEGVEIALVGSEFHFIPFLGWSL